MKNLTIILIIFCLTSCLGLENETENELDDVTTIIEKNNYLSLDSLVSKNVKKEDYYYSEDYKVIINEDTLSIKGFDFSLNEQEKSFGDIGLKLISLDTFIFEQDDTYCNLRSCLTNEIADVIRWNGENNSFICLSFHISDSLAERINSYDFFNILNISSNLACKELDVSKDNLNKIYKIINTKYFPPLPPSDLQDSIMH